jgi:hypothetical protein
MAAPMGWEAWMRERWGCDWRLWQRRLWQRWLRKRRFWQWRLGGYWWYDRSYTGNFGKPRHAAGSPLPTPAQ